MSERQAKLKRKNEACEVKKKKKSAPEIVTNIVLVLLVVAVLGVGGWAVYNKLSQAPVNDSQAVTDNAQNTDATVPTIAEYAQSQEKEIDEFLTEYGLSSEDQITGDMLITDIVDKLTLANYAKLMGSDVATLKQSMGLGEDYSDDTPMSVVIEEQQAAAQQTDNSAEAAE